MYGVALTTRVHEAWLIRDATHIAWLATSFGVSADGLIFSFVKNMIK
jgi:hypothetical protein